MLHWAAFGIVDGTSADGERLKSAERPTMTTLGPDRLRLSRSPPRFAAQGARGAVPVATGSRRRARLALFALSDLVNDERGQHGLGLGARCL